MTARDGHLAELDTAPRAPVDSAVLCLPSHASCGRKIASERFADDAQFAPPVLSGAIGGVRCIN